MADSWIYRYEVKGIQGFILATDKLKEIKGASSLIEEIGDLFARARNLFGIDSAAGVEELAPGVAGGATIEVPANLESALRRLMAVWPLLLAHHAPGLQLVQACVPGPRSRTEAWPSLQRSLAKARSRLEVDLPEAGPLALRAPRTGLPAVGFDSGVAVDAAGARKLAAAAEDRLGDRIGSEWTWATDLDELDHSYVGVLHFDGNDLGNRVKWLAEQGRADQLHEFSRQLAQSTMGAVQAAVAATLAPARRGGTGKIPGRPIVVGGDDVTFVVRGDLAIPFAHRLLEEFQSRNAKAVGGPLFASAGLALVHRHYPFRSAHDLAEELCKFAKDRFRGSGAEGSTPSSLAFYRLTSSSSGRWEEIRRRELSAHPPASSPRNSASGWLSLCPYQLDSLGAGPSIDGLVALAAALEMLPQGPVQEWVNLLRQDPLRALPHYNRFKTVQTQRGSAAAFEKLEAALSGLGATNGWRQISEAPSHEVHASPLLDALTCLRMQSAT